MKLSFILITILCYNFTFSQNHNLKPLTQNDSLYIIAISKYVDEQKDYNKKYFPERKDEQILYVHFKEYFRLPQSINGVKVIILTHENRYHFIKQNGGELTYVDIRPLSYENDSFYIHLVPYHAKMKNKRKLYLSLSDWSRVYFKIRNEKLIFEKIKSEGI